VINKRFSVIGGGLVGLATAYRLRESFPDATIILWEKEDRTGAHQSTHNSGVLHAGLYYKPGSLKAKMAVEGIRQMVAFCQENNVPHEICGKLVVATNDSQLDRLTTLLDRGQKNGLRDLQLLDEKQLKDREPHARGVAAVAVPEEGIVDYAAVVQRMTEILKVRDVDIRLGSPVQSLHWSKNQWRVANGTSQAECDFLINCAGLHCDRIAQMAGEKRTTRIVPFRGEYYQLKKDREHLVKHLIYPVPDPTYPFLGVHFTRMIHGGVEAGPNAVLAMAREGYRKGAFRLTDAWDAVTFSGLWRFALKHKKMCWDEMVRSHSKRLFCLSLQELVPEVQVSDLEPGGAGVRAQAMGVDGSLVQDFELLQRPNAVHVINAPSPGATASLAIGQHIVGIVRQQLGMSSAQLAN
jgi:L-2-hydroxyglutarate oxidase